jgi:murein DD-endopeptidase MepM/ murein hydrolase activator NlpD
MLAAASPASRRQRAYRVISRLSVQYAPPEMRPVTAENLAGAFEMPLRVPVTEAQVRSAGDVREYRAGVHQGVDFYGLTKGAPVYPAARGIVVRADREYTAMSAEYRRKLLDRCRELSGTPGSLLLPPDGQFGDILDQLRGRQVWVYHGLNEQGEVVLSIYGHLDDVASVGVGQLVSPGEPIGTVGNTGTSMEGVSDTLEVHLHLEILVGERYWLVRRPDEVGKAVSGAREGELRRATLQALNGLPPAVAQNALPPDQPSSDSSQ